MSVIYKGVHHRNPSGKNNKINWLLSEAKWDADKLDSVLKDVEHGDSVSWDVVHAMAYAKILHARDLDRELIEALDRYIATHNVPHYILDHVSSLQDYIREELDNG